MCFVNKYKTYTTYTDYKMHHTIVEIDLKFKLEMISCHFFIKILYETSMREWMMSVFVPIYTHIYRSEREQKG